MQIDKTTLLDLAIFHAEEDQSVWNNLNYCKTHGGSQWLRHLLSHPHKSEKPIIETQESLKIIMRHLDAWPEDISNGTILVLNRYYESQIDRIPKHPTNVVAFSYRFFHTPDYGLVKYTTGHAIDFLKGMFHLVNLLAEDTLPTPLKKLHDETILLLNQPKIKEMIAEPSKEGLSGKKILDYGQYLLYHFRDKMDRLTDIYYQIDAFYSMACAIRKQNLHFPTFIDDQRPYIGAEGLFHLLLETPIPYDLEMKQENNFIFLTGANMAGKSTFIKSVGVAIYLAHIGMAVPATSMQLTLFHGLLSNIQVADNITKGESYFFNEVQRIKNTILKINNGQKWLVLIDELFKGTNVQDAMRCSSAVIKGLLKIKNSLFILSTHLYEIGEDLKPYPNIAFRYFETEVTEEKLSFSYQLREGISNDRLGYLILKREGVVDLMDKL
jgi:DNA mismatch repair ATPase MutS